MKIVKICFEIGLRFTWCPAHIGIVGNELADVCTKSAGLSENWVLNLIAYKEIISSLKNDYDKIDSDFINRISQGTKAYYMNNFREIKVNSSKG